MTATCCSDAPNKMDASAMSAVRAIGVAADHSLTQNLTQRRHELANTEAALRQQRETLALSATAVESLRKAEFQLNSERLSVRILGQARRRLESHLRSTRRHLQAGRVQDAVAVLQISQIGQDSEDEEEEDQEEDQEEGQEQGREGAKGQEEDSEMQHQ